MTKSEDIGKVQRENFQEVYKARVVDSDLPDPFSARKTVVIDNLDKKLLVSSFTGDELTDALKDMKANKCPGSDGLSADLYKKVWEELADSYLECVNTVFHRGLLSNEQRRGVITLIPKKDKDRRYMSSWRPITLLNVDYKVLSKCLSKSVQVFIKKAIGGSSFMKIKPASCQEGILEQI